MVTKKIVSLLVLLGMFQFMACNKSDTPQIVLTETQRVTQLLVGANTNNPTWLLDNVTVDDVDYTDVFAGFTITFTETGLTSTNGSLVFDATDAWTFNDDAAKIISTSNVDLTIETLTENQLIFSFMWDETIYGGRSAAVGGRNIFTLSR